MREYDENIRQYTPILQRIIILVAVIIAVPVVLWTITAFVRSYVGPPQLPTFRPLAANQLPANAAPQTSTPVQVADAQTNNTASDAHALLQIKKPQASDALQTAPSTSAPAMSAPAASQPLQQTTTAIADLAAPADSAPTPSPSAAAVAAPISVPPPPFAATRSASATVAAPNAALGNVAPPQAATAPATTTPVPTTPWPNPAAITPSLDAQPASLGTPSEQTAASNDNTADNVPAGTPLKGKIPLPLRRPVIAGSTNMAAQMASHVALAGGGAAGIPLPRARPAAAPEAAPVSDTPTPAYDPSQIH